MNFQTKQPAEIKTKRPMRKPLVIANLLPLLLATIMATAVADGLTRIGRHAINQWRFPILFLDSWSYVLRDNVHPFEWIVSQHNEHRLVWAKLSTIFETELLKIPPTSTAIAQTLLLTLANLGLAMAICRSVQTQPLKLLLLWLSCALLLLNPWQWGSFFWEFQTPWILTNSLTLLTTLLLCKSTQACSKNNRATLTLIAIPWIAIYNTGQGFALAAALIIITLLIRVRLSILILISTTGATLSYIWLLPYAREGLAIRFSLRFLLTVLGGGNWSGLSLLLASLTALIISMKPTRMSLKNLLLGRPELMLPGLFAIVFALMTTLSRASMGLSKASSGYYISHTLMLALSLLLITAQIDAATPKLPHGLLKSTKTPSEPYNLISLAVIATTLFSLPQGLFSANHSYLSEWRAGQELYWRNYSYNQCYSRKASTRESERASIHCGSWETWPPEELKLDYYMGRLSVKPLGWHQSMVQNNFDASRSSSRHHLSHNDPDSLRFLGSR